MVEEGEEELDGAGAPGDAPAARRAAADDDADAAAAADADDDDAPAPVEISALPDVCLHAVLDALGPRDLALAGSACRAWRAASARAPWGAWHAALWPAEPPGAPPPAGAPGRAALAARMRLARAPRAPRAARPERLAAHGGGVKCVRVLPELGVLLTGGLDRRLCAWDLGSGARLAEAAPHAGTVRCLALDEDLLATGSSDHRIRVWRRADAGGDESEGEGEGDVAGEEHGARRAGLPFTLGGARAVLAGGHAGPVAALALAPTCLVSGSWDYSVRVWARGAAAEGGDGDASPGGLRCTQAVHFDDWISSLAWAGTSGSQLLVGAGADGAALMDAGGGALRPLAALRPTGTSGAAAGVAAVASAPDGRLAFLGAADGGVHAADLRMPPAAPGALRLVGAAPRGGAVTGLSFAFPWLAASTQGGEVLLLDAERAVGYPSPPGGAGAFSGAALAGGPWPRRELRAAGGGEPADPAVGGGAPCVHVAGRWLAAGFEGGGVAVWNWGAAAAAADAAAAARTARHGARDRRAAAAAARRAAGGAAKRAD
jgi:hypothetical protein